MKVLKLCLAHVIIKLIQSLLKEQDVLPRQGKPQTIISYLPATILLQRNPFIQLLVAIFKQAGSVQLKAEF